MKITGVIAEYNPFHSGHAYQLSEARRRTGCDYLIVCMDGSYTQRGATACASKWLRAEMALRCGADAVFELPALYAVRTADVFARGGVAILDGLGTDALCFGSESDDADFLRALAELRENEPEAVTCGVRERLADGKSHARAWGEAAAEALGADPALLNSPNIILAAEYLRAIRSLGSQMQAVPVLRLGDYHAARAFSETAAGTDFPSAAEILNLRECGAPLREICAELSEAGSSAQETFGEPRNDAKPHGSPLREIRCGISESGSSARETCGEPRNDAEPQGAPSKPRFLSAEEIRAALRGGRTDDALAAVPEAVRPLLGRIGPMHAPDDLLLARLRSMTPEEAAALPDVAEGLENRLLRCAAQADSEEALLTALKCRRYTRARLARLCAHALLGLTADLAARHPAPEYARLIGLRADAKPLLAELKARARLPIVSNAAALRENEVFRLECRATDLRALQCDRPEERRAGQEFTQKFVIIPD